MSNDRDVRPAGRGRPIGSRNDTRLAARRRLLTTLGAGAAASAALPTRWSRPVADSVLLPAHAQTSSEPPPATDPVTACPQFLIDFRWYTSPGSGEWMSGGVDGTLIVEEPGGTIVGPNTGPGTSLQHQGDGGTRRWGSERITLRPGAVLVPGEYRIGIGYGDADVTLEIIGCDGSLVLTTAFFAVFANDLQDAARMYVGSDGSISAAGSPAGALF